VTDVVRHPNHERHPKSIASGHSALVLGGGPDAEREVSLVSSRAVADALEAGGIPVIYEIIDRITPQQLKKLGGDVIVPILHGPFGEGGQLQELLEQDGRPYIGCGPIAARQAMDKIATKLAAARVGVPTAPAAIFNPADSVSSIELPVVLKPVHEGSSVGVHLCHTRAAWADALPIVREDLRINPDRTYMVERLIAGSEITVGVLDPTGPEACALPPIEIRPAVEFYDYEAKYNRDDTQYIVDPKLPSGVKDAVQKHALALARELGVRHLCRVDFLLDHDGRPWLLEVNTMPGFTGHSLLPMAAGHIGLDMPRLGATLMSWAARDRRPMN
jgi:D-alanine-D-alanine ligase